MNTLAHVSLGIVVALLIFVTAYWSETNKGASPSNGVNSVLISRTPVGQILVDSPEIYTRERLVNDRFREDAWLRERLQKIDELQIGIQGIVRTKSSNSARGQLQIGIGQPNSPTPSPEGQSSAPGTSTSTENGEKRTPTGMLRDLFQQLLDIRAAIRQQIIENQLDDRHDIGANTLYNFKFDATVFTPARNISAWAKIDIEISQPDDETNLQALNQLYRDWIDHLRNVLRREYQRRVNVMTKSFLRGSNEQASEWARFLEFLRQDFALVAQPISSEDSRKVREIEQALLEQRRAALGSSGVQTSTQDFELEVVHYCAIISHLNVLNYETDKIDVFLNWLLAKWVEFDVIDRPELKSYVSVGIVHLDKDVFRIDVGALVQEGEDFASSASPAFDEFEIRPADLDVGFQNFVRRITRPEQAVFTYSVAPKQSVEQISDISAREIARDLGFSLEAEGPQSSASLSTKLSKSLSALAWSIRRTPIIVGYGDRGKARAGKDEAVFGWLVGPRFQPEGRAHHIPVQNSLSALISLPAGWPRVKIHVHTSWIDESGKEIDPRTYSYAVQLPGDLDKLTIALSEFRSRAGHGSGPEVYENELESEDIVLRVGQKASILIPGRDLWRSTVVTVGAQASHMITVLPNMEGIIAHFNPILPPARWTNGEQTEGEAVIRVWTSEGTKRLTTPARIIVDNAPNGGN